MPSENALVSFLGYGEGWHNYHHAFPWDYKASEFGMKLNFTRDLIEFLERIGLAYDLKEASPDMMLAKIINRGDGTHRLWGKNQNFVHSSATTEEQQTGW